jgi:sirohydrochlorin ferrochelatase
MKTMVVLAAHGAPARDYPRWKVGVLMGLEMSPLGRLRLFSKWEESLAEDVRAWPRTLANDPYKTAVDELAAGLQADLGLDVIVGYNEFCLPTISAAIEQAVTRGAERVIIIPTMLLRGNEHTEAEIAGAVEAARQRFPQVQFEYAWPFELPHMLALFAGQVRQRMGG